MRGPGPTIFSVQHPGKAGSPLLSFSNPSTTWKTGFAGIMPPSGVQHRTTFWHPRPQQLPAAAVRTHPWPRDSRRVAASVY